MRVVTVIQLVLFTLVSDNTNFACHAWLQINTMLTNELCHIFINLFYFPFYSGITGIVTGTTLWAFWGEGYHLKNQYVFIKPKSYYCISTLILHEYIFLQIIQFLRYSFAVIMDIDSLISPLSCWLSMESGSLYLFTIPVCLITMVC